MPLCSCSICILHSFQDSKGTIQHGQMVNSRTAKEHLVRDTIRMAQEDATDAEIENKILLETLYERPAVSSSSLPIRTGSQNQVRAVHKDPLMHQV